MSETILLLRIGLPCSLFASMAKAAASDFYVAGVVIENDFCNYLPDQVRVNLETDVFLQKFFHLLAEWRRILMAAVSSWKQPPFFTSFQ